MMFVAVNKVEKQGDKLTLPWSTRTIFELQVGAFPIVLNLLS